MDLKLGMYEHFKGMRVKVIGVAKNSETLDDFVVYDHLGSDNRSELWIRPLSMFLETVEVDGKQVPRFKYLGYI